MYKEDDIYERALEKTSEEFDLFLEELGVVEYNGEWEPEEIAKFVSVEALRKNLKDWCNAMKRDSAYAASLVNQEVHTALLKRLDYNVEYISERYDDMCAGDDADYRYDLSKERD